ncbi:hypothetical protein GCM10022219_05550 [Microbacterium oryzae]|uniref:DUF559 domain-containing protein n=1 Tax=Microbacterium oryzae TaxID=743009 RepID=A0A6I6DP54_9MICO|nr:type IV toxin-antitoxin system AbiEi family antitoxin domain-containing protein [Microbacterium oryzae]QGU26675.1 DUF559 domain-containing protein [Microbacterium oryzae]
MDLDTALTARHGVARVSTLRAAGVSDLHIRRAARTGALVRPRRGWVAWADADPALIAAAEIGAVITCISQAARLNLWTIEDGAWHLGMAAHAKPARRTSAHIHWALPAVPRHPDDLVDPIENVLVLTAACQPYENALVVWESAMKRGLFEPAAMERLHLGPAARRLLHEALPFADSGLETLVVPRLRWLRLPLRRQVHIAGHRVDLLIGERLVLQIDGGHHVGPQRDQDNAHDAQLRLMGYHVIRVSYAQIVFDWASVQDLIVRAVAQGLHRAAR